MVCPPRRIRRTPDPVVLWRRPRGANRRGLDAGWAKTKPAAGSCSTVGYRASFPRRGTRPVTGSKKPPRQGAERVPAPRRTKARRTRGVGAEPDVARWKTAGMPGSKASAFADIRGYLARSLGSGMYVRPTSRNGHTHILWQVWCPPVRSMAFCISCLRSNGTATCSETEGSPTT